MSKSILTKKEQIEVLKKARENYSRDILVHKAGMCFFIYNAIYKIYDIDLPYGELKNYIPTFTIYHLQEACKLGKLEIEYPIKHAYWWEINDIETRLKVFDFLIEELEK